MSRFVLSKLVGLSARLASVPVNRRIAISATRFASWGPDKVPVDRKQIEFRVFKSVASHDKVSDQSALKLETHLLNDLGLDSLDQVEVVMAIEDEFEIDIEDVAAEKLFTVNDIVNFVVDTLDNQPDLPKNPGHKSNPNMGYGIYAE